MKTRFVSAVAALVLLGGLPACTKSPEPVDHRGKVDAVDATAGSVTIDGTPYTAGEGVVIGSDIAVGDSVEYTVQGTTLKSIGEIEMPAAPAPVVVDSTGLGAAVDSTGAAIGNAVDSAGAAIGNAVDSLRK